MAKALYGHMGGLDVATVDEVVRLRRRVREMQEEIDQLRAASEALATLLTEDRLVDVTVTAALT